MFWVNWFVYFRSYAGLNLYCLVSGVVNKWFIGWCWAVKRKQRLLDDGA